MNLGETHEEPYKGYLVVYVPAFGSATAVKVDSLLGIRVAKHEAEDPQAIEKVKTWIDQQ